MFLESCSFLGDQSIARFQHWIQTTTILDHVLLGQKANQCGCSVVLVTPDSFQPERLRDTSNSPLKIAELFLAWKSIEYSNDVMIQEVYWRIIQKIGHRPNSVSVTLWQFNRTTTANHFFILLNGREEHGLPLHDIFMLCNVWQIEQGCLPIHGAGVIHNGGLYLFVGPSGAGKSTVAALSRELGKEILDEDQVLLYLSAGGIYVADGWGYSIQPLGVPLWAIFSLAQDTEERLIPLKQSEVGRLIIKRHLDIMGPTLTDTFLQHSVTLAANIARSIPGYELHFRKSPDFWKLIDERFPG